MRKRIGYILWAVLIVLCIVYKDQITADNIARLTPAGTFISAVLILSLFALKSLSIVIFAGILYAASGLLFPLPYAIILNLAGTIIMITLPYLIGKKQGASLIEKQEQKYPLFQRIKTLRQNNSLFYTLLIRSFRFLPLDPVSMYLGASQIPYVSYLAGSLPLLAVPCVTYPLMSTSLNDIHSPVFRLSFFINFAVSGTACLVSVLYLHNHRKTEQSN